MHSIRLREPWQCSTVDEITRFRRRFGKRTGLEADDRVELVVEGNANKTRITLNGSLIHSGSVAAMHCDITKLLLPRNELVIECASQPNDVRLEIYTAGSV